MEVERLFLVTFGRANLAPEELALGMEHAGGSQWGNLGGKACGVGEATRRRFVKPPCVAIGRGVIA